MARRSMVLFALVWLVLSSVSARSVSAQADTTEPTPISLFHTDFSTRADRWRLLDLKTSAVRYQDDGLQLAVTAANKAVWTFPDSDLKPDEFAMKLTGTWNSGGKAAMFGLVTRYRTETDMQIVAVSREGKLYIGNYTGASLKLIGKTVQLKEKIGETVALEVLVRKAKTGLTLTVTIDDNAPVTVALPAEKKPYSFGLFAQSGTEPGLAVTLNTLTVTLPQ